jgi:PAS domain S-box-containing protein
MAHPPSMADVSERRLWRPPNHESVTTSLFPTRPPSQFQTIVRRVLAFGEALLAVSAAGALSWELRDDLVATRLLLFWVASTYAAWRGGLWPALLTAFIGSVIANFTTTQPVGQFTLPSPEELTSAVIFVFVSGILGSTFDRLRRTRAESIESARQLSLASEQLQDQAVELENQLEESHVMTEELEHANEELGALSFANEHARRQLEQALERYRALIEASTAVVWTADPAGKVDDMPAWREFTGQSRLEVHGFGWLEAIHAAERDTVRAGWRAAIASGNVFEAEFRLRRRDGTHRWFHSRAVPIRHDRRIVEWVGVFDDTHDAHVDAERRAAVENALSVLGSSLDYQWTLAALTRLVVPALADYCSVDLVESDGSTRGVSATHVDPEKEAVLRELWSRYPFKATDRVGVPEVVRTGEPQVSVDIDQGTLAAFAHDPEHAALLAKLGPRSYACLPMSARGHVFGALSLVYSDSGRRYGEADLAAAQEIAARAATAIDNARLYASAQTANRAKSDFLATMSHELRTPLNAIAGYVELLSTGLRGPVNEAQLRDLSRIQQNQQHLLEIITDILSFSRLEAGRVRYRLAPVPVREVLSRMEAMIEPQARARSVEYCCVNIADGLSVVADREKLEQVLINLLGNAVKFTPSGGRITLSATDAGDRIALRVQDTGIGIEPWQMGSIFEPFVQLEPSLTRTTEGAGLGLAISRELTRGMGGEISVTSVPGEGSTFVVELPRAAAGDQLVG